MRARPKLYVIIRNGDIVTDPITHRIVYPIKRWAKDGIESICKVSQLLHNGEYAIDKSELSIREYTIKKQEVAIAENQLQLLAQYQRFGSLKDLQEIKQGQLNLRKEVCDQIYNLFTKEEMWSTLKRWWLSNGECNDLRKVLDAVANGDSNGEIIVKHSKNAGAYARMDNSFLNGYKEYLDKGDK